MRKVLKDEDVLKYLKEQRRNGRTSVRAGEVARRFSVDSVRAIGAMERVKSRLHRSNTTACFGRPTRRKHEDETRARRKQEPIVRPMYEQDEVTRTKPANAAVMREAAQHEACFINLLWDRPNTDYTTTGRISKSTTP